MKQYKNYKAIYEIFSNATEETLRELVAQYTIDNARRDPGFHINFTEYQDMALLVVVLIAKSDGLTDDEIQDQVVNKIG